MYLSKKYIMPSFTEYVKAKLVRNIEPGNVLDIFEQTFLFEESDLERKCWQVIECRTNEVIMHVSELCQHQANNARQFTEAEPSQCVSEIKLFQAVLKWIDHQCSERGLELTTENRRSVIGNAVHDLRFLALNQEEFAKHVSKSGLLNAEELVPIYEKFSNLPSPLLKWTLSKREVYDPTLKMLRICRFSIFAKNTVLWPYKCRGGGLAVIHVPMVTNGNNFRIANEITCHFRFCSLHYFSGFDSSVQHQFHQTLAFDMEKPISMT